MAPALFPISGELTYTVAVCHVLQLPHTSEGGNPQYLFGHRDALVL
jgi:hypothetical protein